MNSEKDMFLNTWEREFQTTMKVLRAYPLSEQDWRPHPKSRTAKELVWAFVGEEIGGIQRTADGKPSFENLPKIPSTMKEAISEYERIHMETVKKIKKMPDEALDKKIKFFAGPGKMADMRILDIMWSMVMDMIHHRGQFSIYVRMAGGKVPSIYGPTADEPWTEQVMAKATT